MYVDATALPHTMVFVIVTWREKWEADSIANYVRWRRGSAALEMTEKRPQIGGCDVSE